MVTTTLKNFPYNPRGPPHLKNRRVVLAGGEQEDSLLIHQFIW
jgi:hypothetical protein